MTSFANHPRLLNSDAESVRVFLLAYDQYCREVNARAVQLTVSDAVVTETIRPVSIKYCVDAEYIESALLLDLIPGATDYKSLTDDVLRKYLEDKARESKETVSLATLDKIVERKLHMNMSDSSAKSRMQSLFVSYTTLLRRHGLAWVLESNQKVAVYHVLSAVRPLDLRNR